MFRFLAILFLVYVVYRLFKMLFVGLFAARTPRQDNISANPEAPKKGKIISEEEGEYVDFEEIKKD